MGSAGPQGRFCVSYDVPLIGERATRGRAALPDARFPDRVSRDLDPNA
jgi:hypothetical protein